MPDKLEPYRSKRDFKRTAEPAGDGASPPADAPRFVIQEHDATRLHWDLRLEHDGVAVSWAIPNGIPSSPKENRLAVHTEDHPLQYLEFAGTIPDGQYGAGTMRIWDHGTFETITFDSGKVEVILHGERLHGRYGLFPIGRAGEKNEADWMIHRMDPPQDPDWVPMPEHVEPMLARAGELPSAPERWSFEVKWDGVRALAYARPGRLRLESRNLKEITDSYPEIRGILRELGMREAVLDGEIVSFDSGGRPSFSALQRRMHVTSPAAVRRLSAQAPVVYAIFDLLYLDGQILTGLAYDERRAMLDGLGLGGPAWRVPATHPGNGAGLLAATAEQGLEGIVAKRRDSRYEPGARNGAWVKIKHTRRQELVIGGWLPGTGKRAARIGALLMGHHDETGALRFAGRVGTGFTERSLGELAAALAPLAATENPFSDAPKLPATACFARPELVAEIEFVEWTPDGMMRAPSFKGLRDDKRAIEVVREDPVPERATPARSGTREELFDESEALPGGGLAVRVDGRALTLSNWDKVLYPQTGFTKGDLITYYARIAPVVLPHLRDRALTLKRYPNGVDAQYFYEKNSPVHRPDWVRTARVGGIDYTLVQERATLVWLANLADIELHTPLALSAEPARPTMLVFDLDPGPPAGIVECCQVALVLHGMFDALGLRILAKTSGSKGLQLYVPLDTALGFEQTKSFARHVAGLLEQRLPELVVARISKQVRAGKVLIDWGQNDANKTTVTVYSLRALPVPGVSTPVGWDEVQACLQAGTPDTLTFTPEDVLRRVRERGDLFAEVLTGRQTLPALA